jgi:type I restriction-modification system DNA methylase subunit
MLLTEFDEDREDPYTVLDPASGSGRLLVSAAKQIPDGVDAVFYGQDKDSTCAKMTALNLCFFNMDGYAILGDSLLQQRRRVWQTTGSFIGGSIRELGDDEFDNPYQDVKNEVENQSGDANRTGSEDSGNGSGVSSGDSESPAGESAVDLRETTLSDYNLSEQG